MRRYAMLIALLAACASSSTPSPDAGDSGAVDSSADAGDGAGNDAAAIDASCGHRSVLPDGGEDAGTGGPNVQCGVSENSPRCEAGEYAVLCVGSVGYTPSGCRVVLMGTG